MPLGAQKIKRKKSFFEWKMWFPCQLPAKNNWWATFEIWSGTLRDELSRETMPYKKINSKKEKEIKPWLCNLIKHY